MDKRVNKLVMALMGLVMLAACQKEVGDTEETGFDKNLIGSWKCVEAYQDGHHIPAEEHSYWLIYDLGVNFSFSDGWNNMPPGYIDTVWYEFRGKTVTAIIRHVVYRDGHTEDDFDTKVGRITTLTHDEMKVEWDYPTSGHNNFVRVSYPSSLAGTRWSPIKGNYSASFINNSLMVSDGLNFYYHYQHYQNGIWGGFIYALFPDEEFHVEDIIDSLRINLTVIVPNVMALSNRDTTVFFTRIQ